METNSNQKSRGPIKRLTLAWKAGQVVTTPFLETMGVTKQLASYLKKTGVLAPMGRGAFRKATESPIWAAALEAMQQQLALPVYVGGRSALELQGLGQYATLGLDAPVWLFVADKLELPQWLTAHDWGVRLRLVRANLFRDAGAETSRMEIERGFVVCASRRERAILEAIHLVGKEHRFEEVAEIFEGLATLDPEVTQRLLEGCRSNKVKRVFLYLARESGHAWYGRLDLSKVDIGKGKREIFKGGKLDAEFQITVPRRAEEPDV